MRGKKVTWRFPRNLCLGGVRGKTLEEGSEEIADVISMSSPSPGGALCFFVDLSASQLPQSKKKKKEPTKKRNN